MTEFEKLPAYSAGQRTMVYAGVGSRRTPKHVLDTMVRVAQRLEQRGYTLRSGGAQGADRAFEQGTTTCQVFYASDATDITRTIAREIHPAPWALRGYVLDLMARNTLQVFGRGLDTPVDFLVCWTPDGAETAAERTRNTGGTGQAIEMAARKGIPVINMARTGWQHRIAELLD